MATFTTRVELHDADEVDYNNLHSAMEKEGFSRTIKSSDGITYKLPAAEYNRTGEITKEDVLESAKRAAIQTSKKYGILVTESYGRQWIGLTKV